MQQTNPLRFEYSYLSLPDTFYSLVKPTRFPNPELVLLNDSLCAQLNVSPEHIAEGLLDALNKQTGNYAKTYAQAYAGHQFGHFTQLGDGRAVMIGEHITSLKARFDFQLKGSGQTNYSRRGDGKATLKAMLREYLMSEAMHYLNIPSSRSLGVVKTGESVFRETTHEGAVLLRVMQSHIRVGTFEYAAYLGSVDDLHHLANYTIRRLYPEIEGEDNPVLSLLNKVIQDQVTLVVHWMRVGFIHGVMNTDNTSVSGETFDYGPCAFLNTYDPNKSYSSIDQHGRYAFGNQPKITKWNLARFAEALLPILHPDEEQSIKLAQDALEAFDAIWYKSYYATMLRKIGIENNTPELYVLIDELLDLMHDFKLDYTNTFLHLSENTMPENSSMHGPDFKYWLAKRNKVINQSNGMQTAKTLMRNNNPVVIPRNHLVEQALDEAIKGDLTTYKNLLNTLSKPYEYPSNACSSMMHPDLDFDKGYQTFCGT